MLIVRIVTTVGRANENAHDFASMSSVAWAKDLVEHEPTLEGYGVNEVARCVERYKQQTSGSVDRISRKRTSKWLICIFLHPMNASSKNNL